MNQAITRPKRQINRDKYTWYIYFLFVIFGYHQSVLGSVTPFLRDELVLSKTAIGWHFSIYAIGLFLAGRFIAPSVANRLIAPRLQLAALLTTGFVAALSVPLPIAGTLSLALCLGLAGGTMQATLQEALARHHGDKQGMALTEAFVFGGLGVFLGPLVIGFAVQAGLDWRLTLVFPLFLLAGVLAAFGGERRIEPARPQPISSATPSTAGARLPMGVVLVLGMILLGIATEWGIGFWGAQFLEVQLSVSPEAGVTLMSAFFGGTVIGRMLASQLLRIFDERSLLIAAIILGGASVFLLWAIPVQWVTVVALMVAGMCLGNFFPLILSIANKIAPDQPAAISAGATQAVGLALLIVPVVLGNLGDTIGLRAAVGLLCLLPVAMLILLWISGRPSDGGTRR